MGGPISSDRQIGTGGIVEQGGTTTVVTQPTSTTNLLQTSRADTDSAQTADGFEGRSSGQERSDQEVTRPTLKAPRGVTARTIRNPKVMRDEILAAAAGLPDPVRAKLTGLCDAALGTGATEILASTHALVTAKFFRGVPDKTQIKLLDLLHGAIDGNQSIGNLQIAGQIYADKNGYPKLHEEQRAQVDAAVQLSLNTADCLTTLKRLVANPRFRDALPQSDQRALLSLMVGAPNDPSAFRKVERMATTMAEKGFQELAPAEQGRLWNVIARMVDDSTLSGQLHILIASRVLDQLPEMTRRDVLRDLNDSSQKWELAKAEVVKAQELLDRSQARHDPPETISMLQLELRAAKEKVASQAHRFGEVVNEALQKSPRYKIPATDGATTDIEEPPHLKGSQG